MLVTALELLTLKTEVSKGFLVSLQLCWHEYLRKKNLPVRMLRVFARRSTLPVPMPVTVSLIDLFVSFPQKRNGIVFSSGVNYLHSGGNIQSELSLKLLM